jgi:hypothetical protein
MMGFTQSNEFIITGKFKVDGGSNNDAQIILEKDGRKVKTLEGEARFELGLDFQAIYIVSFVKEGFVTKKLRFDTHVAEERIEYGFEPFEFMIEIFGQFDDVSVVVFNQPVGKIAYSDLIDEFDYDTDYTKSIQTQIAEVMEQVEEKKEEKETKLIEEQKKLEAQEKQIASLTSAAEKSLNSDKPEEALQKLEEAAKIKDTPEINKKIEETKKKIEQKAQEQEKKQQFDGILAEAETAKLNGDLLGAKRLYEQANGLMEGDPKVSESLGQINKQIADQERNEEQFKALEGDALAAKQNGDLAGAIEKAEAALKIKPDSELEKLVADLKGKLEEEKAEKAAKAEKEKELEALMAEASKQRDNRNLSEALATLESANAISPSPKIQGLIDEIKKEKLDLESAEKAAAEQKEKVENLLDQAKGSLEQGDLETARLKAQEAEALSPNVAKEVLTSIAKKEEEQASELAKVEEQKKEYEELVSKANQALEAGDFIEASKGFNNALEIKPDGDSAIKGLKAIEEQKAAAELAEAQKLKEEEDKKAKIEELIASADASLAHGDLDGAKNAYAAAGELSEDKRIEKGLGAVEKAIELKRQEESSAAEIKQRFDDAMSEGSLALSEERLVDARKAFENANRIMESPEAIAKLEEVSAKENEIAALKLAEEERLEAEKLAKEETDAAEKLRSEAEAEAKRLEEEVLAEKKKQEEEAEAERLKNEEAALKAEEKEAIENEKAEAERIKAENEAEEERLKAEELEAIAREKAEAERSEADEKAKREESEAINRQEELNAKSQEQKQEQYLQLISKADKAFDKSELETAATLYEQALEINPNEAYPKERLDGLTRTLAELGEKEKSEKMKAELEDRISQLIEEGDALSNEDKLDMALSKYQDAFNLKKDASVQKMIDATQARIEKKIDKEEKAKEAAQAIANGPRESNELSDIIQAESEKQKAVIPEKKPVVKPVVSEPKKSTTIPGGAVVISENRVGKEALDSPAAVMSEDDAYDGMMKKVEEEAFEMQVEAEQRVLKEKYPERKTTETEKAGNSIITYVYINRGDYVNVYKKVEHSWGGVFFFIDERATNQRFWEHETQ